MAGRPQQFTLNRSHYIYKKLLFGNFGGEQNTTRYSDETDYAGVGTLTNMTGAEWGWANEIGRPCLTHADQDYVLTSSALLLPGSGIARTYSAWIKPTANTSGAYCFHWSSGAGQPYFSIRLSAGTPRPIVYLGSSNYQYYNNTDSSLLLDGSWHHVALYLAGNGQADIDNCALWIDGVVSAKNGSAVKTGATGTFDRCNLSSVRAGYNMLGGTADFCVLDGYPPDGLLQVLANPADPMLGGLILGRRTVWPAVVAVAPAEASATLSAVASLTGVGYAIPKASGTISAVASFTAEGDNAITGTDTLVPDGDVARTNFVTSTGGTTNLYAEIDNGSDDTDDSTHIKDADSQSESSYTCTLSDTSASFGEAQSATVNIRCKRSTSSGDVKSISRIQVMESDGTTALTSSSTLDLTTTATVYEVALTVTGATTKAAWDGAKLVITCDEGTNGIVYIYEVAVDVTYAVPGAYADLSGVGGLSPVGYALPKAAGTLSGIASLTAVGSSVPQASASLDAVADQDATGYARSQASATLGAVADQTAVGYRLSSAGAELSAEAGLDATGYVLPQASADLSAVADFTAVGETPEAAGAAASANLSGVAGITAVGYVLKSGSVNLSAIGLVEGIGYALPLGYANLSAVATLYAVGSRAERAVLLPTTYRRAPSESTTVLRRPPSSASQVLRRSKTEPTQVFRRAKDRKYSNE